VLRFLADCNVGRLARWLRALGYDADYAPRLDDPQLVATALAQGRVLLTRDAQLMQRRPIATGQLRAVLLREDQVDNQLRQLRSELGLDGKAALTRCLECNLELEPRQKAEVADRLPPYVRATQGRFSACPGCQRVYWPGTHWDRMRARIAAL
jgi:uncharacterized protein with PIN domain